MSEASISSDPSDYVNNISLSRTVFSYNLAIAVLFCYQYLTHLPDEINYIWPAKWNFGKILYLLIRYSAFIDISLLIVSTPFRLTPSQCKSLLLAEEWLFIFGVGVVAIMLGLRTWVIWLRSRIIAYILGGLFCICWTAKIYFAASASRLLTITDNPLALPGCYQGVQHRAFYHFYIVALLVGGFETAVVILTWIRLLRDRKRGLNKVQSPVIAVLYKDAQLTHVYPMLGINILFLTLDPKSVFLVLLGFQRAIHSMFASRSLLRLKMANESRITESEQSRAFSKLVFQNLPPLRAAAKNQQTPARNLGQRSFMDDLRADVESWFAPDPEVFPASGPSEEEILSETSSITEVESRSSDEIGQ